MSIQQGILFNQLQDNITSGINNRLLTNLPAPKKANKNKKSNTKGSQEGFTDKIVNDRYAKVSDDYVQIQTELQQNNKNIVNRMNARTNPYLGKNITLNQDTENPGYVTDQGVFKAYNPSTWADTPGKFGCPPAKQNTKVSVNEDDQLNASTPDYTFTTDNFPSLLVGTPMKSGSACGGAGQNVYVNRLVDVPDATYLGCYKNSDGNGNGTNAMSDVGEMSYSGCLSTAMTGEYPYFALTGGSNTNANATRCRVAKDLSEVQQYGTPSGFQPKLLWQSATKNTGENMNHCTITTTGTLVVRDANSKVLFKSNDAVPACVSGGQINNLVATFGGNCAEKYNVKTGNATNAVMDTYDSLGKPATFSFLINGENIGGNPAEGCSKKSWDVSYLCGNASKVDHIDNASGKNASFNCEAEVAACKFALQLKNNGNVCLFQTDSEGKQQKKIWCMYQPPNESDNDSNNNYVANPDMAAKNGKTGSNTLATQQSLFAGEWVGSNDGSFRLIMQEDGNLCLYSYQKEETCASINQTTNTNTNIKSGVSTDINAVYEIKNMGNKNVLGKMAYIDQDDVLHPYAHDALAYSDKYTILANTNSLGSDLKEPISNSTINSCTKECNNNEKCAGFTFEPTANVCYLKDKTMYPQGSLTAETGITTAVRLPQVKSDRTCSQQTQNISSEKYKHYVKGDTLTKENMNDICNPFANNPISQKTKLKYAKVNKDLEQLGSNITGGIDRLGTNIDNTQHKFAKNRQKMMKSVASYRDIHNQLNSSSSSLSEGMLTMTDLQRMRNDSELIVTHQNVRYIYWMLASLGLITVCFAVARQR